jgi:hypothetical protein
MENDNKQLRKLIRETITAISDKGKLLREMISDESFMDAPPADLKAWLFYYKHHSFICEATIGRILKITLNNQINDEDKLDDILEEWRHFQAKVASLPYPNLN